MLSPAFAFTLLIEVVCGAFGGVAIGHWRSIRTFSTTTLAVTGGLGGLIFTWLAARIPGVGQLVGHIEHAADSTVQATGGFTPLMLVGAGIAGLIGGALLTLFLGMLGSTSTGEGPRGM